MGQEQQIENGLIETLKDLKYLYRDDIRDKASLEANFRKKFESLNRVRLSDREFERLLEQMITPDVFGAAKRLRAVNDFIRDDGTPLNYTLVNVKDWCKNDFEVVHQLRMNTDNSHHRYDVILLINGLPVVQIELKSFAISPRRAMQQIVDYKNDPGNGYRRTLMCFMQIFIVSNGNDTWYFANNNDRHFNFDAQERFLPLCQFADKANKKITQLDRFAEQFLAKCTLGQTISRYMVLVASEEKLLMMRPYQIYAVKAIVESIDQNSGNGYIWHTTGSGKTLTSFKASTLLKDNPMIEKCLFVVDRKDLDRQTREEFNRFQKGCVEENTNTGTLVERLLSDDYADKVIVTTIQKLGLALTEGREKQYRERLKPLRYKRIVFIFDECHRSQFGENHAAIKEFFPQAQLFGFTGTPIFEDNASYKKRDGTEERYVTTKDIFENELHAYTITHAIDDQNVLKFNIDYYEPQNKKGDTPKESIVRAILDKHDTATNHRTFNAILATGRINDAIEYYALFQEIQSDKVEQDEQFKPLNIACVFSPPAEGNRDIKQIQEDLPQEKQDNRDQPEEKKAALNNIISDYNQRYGTNYSIGAFDLYYQDVQKRIKDQQYDIPQDEKIDLVIVVDMLLTGFDARFLNSLYLDKNLKHHGLIQALSRTNRVLNDTKPYGNIIDFRQQKDAVDNAIVLFSGESGEQAREIWLVEDAPTVIEKLNAAVQKLNKFMRAQGLNSTPTEVTNLKGDAEKTQFVELFKQVQRNKIQLDQYTDLTAQDKEAIEQIMPADQAQGFRGAYLETARQLKKKQDHEASPELEATDFELVLFASSVIDYDYIMGLIAQYSATKPGRHRMSKDQIISLMASDARLMDEREDMTDYIATLTPGQGLSEQKIKEGYAAFKAQKNDRQLDALAVAHGIEAAALQQFVRQILTRMVFDDGEFTTLLRPLGLGWKARTDKKLALMEDLIPLLHKRSQGRKISGLRPYETIRSKAG